MGASTPYLSLLEDFLTQKHDWAVTGREPDAATRELRYCMEQQEKRLKKKGLVLDERYDFRDDDITNSLHAGGASLSPFSNRTVYRETLRTREIRSGDRRLRRDEEPLVLYANVTDHAGGGDFPVNCPNCGSVAMASQLEQGCPYCGTFFLMRDLYPKVSSYYTVEQVMDRHDAMNRLKKTFTVIGAALFALCFLLYLWQGKEYVFWFRILYAAFFGGILAAMGAFVSYMAYSGFLLLKLFVMAGKSFAMLPGLGSKKKLSEQMAPYDSLFSPEMFEGRVISKVKAVLFSDDRDSLNLYEGDDDLSIFDDLVNVDYRGAYKLRRFRAEEGRIRIGLEFFLENFYMKDGRLRRRNERLFVDVERSAAAVSDPGYTVSAVQCPGCGASFDAMHEKECPYCGNRYRLDENDWLITGIRKR